MIMNIFMAEITIVAALKYNFFFDQNNLKSIVHVVNVWCNAGVMHTVCVRP